MTHWRYCLPLFAIGATLTTIASCMGAIPWLTPILGAAVAYPIFLYCVAHQQYRRATQLMLLWALCQSVAIGMATTYFPEAAATAISTGPSYTNAMLRWIQTGDGAEGSLRLFLPIHLRHYLIFCGLCCLTASSTALLFGTWMLNYMNFYVARLVSSSVHPWLALVVAWPPWSLLRVIGFILTGVALAPVGLNLIARIRQQPQHQTVPKPYLLLGIGFVVADIIVKATLAPLWRQVLHYALLGDWG